MTRLTSPHRQINNRWITLLGENSPQVSLVSAYLASRGFAPPFVPDYLFKDVCLRRYDVSLQGKGQVCLLSSKIKRVSPFGAKVRQTYCP